MKKRVNFFTLLKEQSEFVSKAMKTFCDYCKSCDETFADEVITIEDEADKIRRELIESLNRAYVTPIDREDLFNLSRQLDELVDYTKISVDEIRLFKLTPNSDVIRIAETLLEMSEHIQTAIQNMEHHADIAKNEAIKVKALENEVDALTKGAYATLFDADDFHVIFKYAEIYRHLNHTADIADTAMDYLLDILVKM